MRHPGSWLWLVILSCAACGGDDASQEDPATTGAGGSSVGGAGGVRAGAGGASGSPAGGSSQGGKPAGGSAGLSGYGGSVSGGAGKGGVAGAGAAGGTAGQGGGNQAGGAGQGGGGTAGKGGGGAGAAGKGGAGAAGKGGGGAAGKGGGAAGQGGGGASGGAGMGGVAGSTSTGGAGGSVGGSGGAGGAGGCDPIPSQGVLAAVATFESMGLTLAGVAQPGVNNVASVRFRASGASDWRTGLPLVFDAKKGEYRGSIVYLAPGTTHEVEVTLSATCERVVGTGTTWSETFPVGKTIKVPAQSSVPLEITDSGTPDGYVLVEPEGASAVIDVGHKADYDLRVRGSYVIVRGLTLKGASKHGLVLGEEGGGAAAVHDVVLERNDISGWGTNFPGSAFGTNLQSALYSHNVGLERIIIQRNVLHDPATDSNSWEEKNDQGGSNHPGGPQGISFLGSKGNHVIRYNEIHGNADHRFNDGMGEVNNFSEAGFPNRDTDIYGNYVAYTWDDGLELEGADRNVRVWGNYIDHTYIKIAIAAVSVGPIYIWRNVAEVSQASDIDATSKNKGEPFFKSRNYGGNSTNFGLGAKFLFNNTALAPTSSAPGCFGFLSESVSAGDTLLDNLLRFTVRNNIAHVAPKHTSFNDAHDDPAMPSDFDYDLFDGSATFAPSTLGQEAHGLPKTTPSFVAGYGFDLATRTGVFSLAPGAPGVDAGLVIPNFIETYQGSAPDVGAHEQGEPPMEFGVNAHLP